MGSVPQGRTYSVINPLRREDRCGAQADLAEHTRGQSMRRANAFDKGKWPDDAGDRAAALFKLANLIEADMTVSQPLESQNQGKTIKTGPRRDIPVQCRQFAVHAARPAR